MEITGNQITQDLPQLNDLPVFLRTHGYEFQVQLGYGSLGGIVILGISTKNGSEVAIKIFLEEEHYISECKIMKQLDSPYIAKILDQFENTQKQYFCLVMNYYPDGNLEVFIDEHNHQLSNQQIIEIFSGILKGIICLKEKKIIHCDLKPTNILLTSDNQPVIVDFAFAQQYTDKTVSYPLPLESKVETFMFSPNEQINDKKVVPQSDYYTAGMILYSLCGSFNIMEILGLKQGIFPDVSGRAQQRILELGFQMMARSPEERAAPENILDELKKLIVN